MKKWINGGENQWFDDFKGVWLCCRLMRFICWMNAPLGARVQSLLVLSSFPRVRVSLVRASASFGGYLFLVFPGADLFLPTTLRIFQGRGGVVSLTSYPRIHFEKHFKRHFEQFRGKAGLAQRVSRHFVGAASSSRVFWKIGNLSSNNIAR